MRPLIGVVLLLVGIIWTGQGAGVIHGSFMTGSLLWLAIGLICLVAGAGTLYVVLTERGRGSGGGSPE